MASEQPRGAADQPHKPLGRHGDAPSKLEHTCQPIVFAEWGCRGKVKSQKRDLRFANLTLSSAFGAKDSLFSRRAKHEILTSTKPCPPMTVSEPVAAPPEATL